MMLDDREILNLPLNVAKLRANYEHYRVSYAYTTNNIIHY